MPATRTREPDVVADLREQREADGRQHEAGGHHERRPDPAHEHRRQHRADDERRRPGQRPQPRLERRQPEHQLQVLGDEDEDAEGDEDRRACTWPATR